MQKAFLAGILAASLTMGTICWADDVRLRGWWRLDEGEGAVARDSSGNGHDGIISGCKWESGKNGQPVLLHFRGGQIRMPPSVAQNDLDAGSLLFWFKVDADFAGKNSCLLLSLNDRLEASVHPSSGNLNIDFITQEDCLVLRGGRMHEPEWRHVGIIWSGNKFELWENGKLAMERLATPSCLVQRGGLLIGSGLMRKKFFGFICDVRFYAAALPESEIAALFTKDQRRFNAQDIKGATARKIPLDAASTNLSAPFVKGTYYDQALAESLTPVRPGKPDVAPFWNWNSRQFIYAPVFGPPAAPGTKKRLAGYGGFQEISNAVNYRLTAIASKTGEKFEFEAETPHTALTPIWGQLPVDTIYLVAEAFDKTGKSLGTAGERRFYRAAVFNGIYGRTNLDFEAAGLLATEYLCNMPFVRKWLTEKTPDYDGYDKYCYLSKMIGAMMRIVRKYHEMSADNPGRQAELVRMGQNMADFMIDASLKAGPLAGMPPTYHGDKGAAKGRNDILFIVEPAGVADGYLSIYEITKDTKYLEAALRIAEVYLREQLPDGTWHAHYMFTDAGGPTPSTAPLFVPLGIMQFLKRIGDKYDKPEKYAEVIAKSRNYLKKNVLEPFHFAGQFDDSGGGAEWYRNMAAGAAARAAMWLLDDSQPGNLALAEDIMRFCEDQFVIWERRTPDVGRPAEAWLTPCVVEQSADCFSPVAASAGAAARAFMKLYQTTGKPIYKAKALSLANSFLHAQAPSGYTPTFWVKYIIEHGRRGLDSGFWFNCGVADAQFMLDFAGMLQSGILVNHDPAIPIGY